MNTILIYQCESCKKAWDDKKKFERHAKKRNHLRGKVIKLPKSNWDELCKKYPEEDTI